jgi:hypothetical protein
MTDPRYLRIGIRKPQGQYVFLNLYFSSVFRLFQFLEILELCNNPILMDCLLLQRELRKQSKFMQLMSTGLTIRELQSTWQARRRSHNILGD